MQRALRILAPYGLQIGSRRCLHRRVRHRLSIETARLQSLKGSETSQSVRQVEEAADRAARAGNTQNGSRQGSSLPDRDQVAVLRFEVRGAVFPRLAQSPRD